MCGKKGEEVMLVKAWDKAAAIVGPQCDVNVKKGSFKKNQQTSTI